MEEATTSAAPQSTAAAPVVSAANIEKAKKAMGVFLENVIGLRESIETEQANNPLQDLSRCGAVNRGIKAARNSLENVFLQLDREDPALVPRAAVNTDALMSAISKLLDGREHSPVQVEEVLEKHGIVSVLFVKDVRAPSTGNERFDAAGLTANKAAFDSAGYQNGGFLTLFLNVLSWFALQWNPIYYAPYAALINASMTGKSRSMAELASVGVFTFISCFRPQTAAFYRPRRTPKIADWGTKKTEDVLVFTRQACQYFTGCLEVLLEFLTTTGKDVAASVPEGKACKMEDLTRAWRKVREKEERDATEKDHDDGKTLWGKVWREMQVAYGMVDKLRPSVLPIEEKAHLVIEKFREELESAGLIAEIFKQLSSLVPDLPRNKLHILFAFDEARNLKTADSTSEAKDNFVALRRAMRVLPYRLVEDDPEAAPARPAAPPVDVSGPAKLKSVSTQAASKLEKTELNMFCLVTDTTSAIGNLAPPKELDPSERAGYTGTKLFHPFVNLMGFDSWWKSAGEVQVPKASQSSAEHIVKAVKTALLPRIKETADVQQEGDKQQEQGGKDERDSSNAGPPAKRAKLAVEESSAETVTSADVASAGGAFTPFRELLSMEVLETVEVASMQGRPAFFPNLCARSHFSARTELTDLLVNKILCVDWKAVTGNPQKLFEPSQTQLIAVLGTVASIEISAASELASALCSGHMRPAAGVSLDRHLLYTLEISEPLMAVSARRIMRDPSMSWSRLLQAFRETQLNSTTLPGFLGEFAGQVLLLMADEKVRRSPTFSSSKRLQSPFAFYPLLDLLRALLGEYFVESLGDEVREAFQGGYVRLLQFVKTFACLSRKTLLEYLLRGSGVYCQEMQRGADLGLGVFYPPAESVRDPRLEPVTLGCTGAALVQVKNWSSPMKTSQVQAAFLKLEELHNSKELSSDLPRVSILLELHRPANSSKDGDWNVRLHKPYSPERKILEIHARGLSVADILVDEKDKVSADAAFRQMLKSIVDPKTVETIPGEFRDLVEHMFTVQPYMAEPTDVPVDKFPLKK